MSQWHMFWACKYSSKLLRHTAGSLQHQLWHVCSVAITAISLQATCHLFPPMMDKVSSNFSHTTLEERETKKSTCRVKSMQMISAAYQIPHLNLKDISYFKGVTVTGYVKVINYLMTVVIRCATSEGQSMNSETHQPQHIKTIVWDEI